MNSEEDITAKSYLCCSLSSFLGFRAVLEPFQGFFVPLPLPAPLLDWREDYSTLSHLSRENHKALEFCFGRANLEHYSVILSQLKWKRSLPTRCSRRENITIFAIPFIPLHTFSHQARPRQRSRTIAPQAGVDIYYFCSRESTLPFFDWEEEEDRKTAERLQKNPETKLWFSSCKFFRISVFPFFRISKLFLRITSSLHTCDWKSNETR